MTLNLCVLTPNRIIWDSEVKEILLSTNSGSVYSYFFLILFIPLLAFLSKQYLIQS
ncbi:hypothetical protein AMTRI_Chr07g23370 [Amborella trichopoda]